jgi:hypothetical protein
VVHEGVVWCTPLHRVEGSDERKCLGAGREMTPVVVYCNVLEGVDEDDHDGFLRR